MSDSPPTLYEWAGGAEALERLTETFYAKVREDPLLEPVFRGMDRDHPKYVAMWLGEVFGGPARYTEERGGYPHMMQKHLNRALSEWGTRIAVANSQPGAAPPARAPVPHWGWGEAPPYNPG